MGLFKLRNNKKFDYTPRYYDDKGEGSPYKFQHKFDEYRNTVETPKGLKGRFSTALEDFKNSDHDTNRRVLIIAAILVVIFLALIGFDITIFFKK